MNEFTVYVCNNLPPLIPASELCAKCFSHIGNELSSIKLSCGHYYCRRCDIGLDINNDLPKDYKCLTCDENIDDFKIVLKSYSSKWVVPEKLE